MLSAAVLVLGMFAGGLATNVAADSPPVWSVGDYWKLADPADLKNYTRFEVAKIDAVQQGIDCYELKLELTQKSGSQVQIIEATYWIRKTDIAVVGAEVPAFGYKVFWDPPQKIFDWPLETGRIWTWVDDSGSKPVTHTYKVEGKESQSTKAGTFETWKISDTDDQFFQQTEYMWYSSVAGFWVKEQTKGSDTWQELIEYKHATGGIFPGGFGPESFGLWIIILLIIVVVVVVAALAMRKRKRGAQPAMAPPPMTPAAPAPQPQYQQPYQPGGYQQQPYSGGDQGRVVPGASSAVRR
jgi:hypothetical protein